MLHLANRKRGQRLRKRFAPDEPEIENSDYRPKVKRAFSRASHTAAKLTQNLDAQAAQAQQFAEQFDQFANSGLTLDVRLDAKGAVEILSVQPG